MEMRYNARLVEDITESKIDSIVSVGGASKSRLWMQLKADIIGKTIEGFEEIEPGCAGAAILAGEERAYTAMLKKGMKLLVDI